MIISRCFDNPRGDAHLRTEKILDLLQVFYDGDDRGLLRGGDVARNDGVQLLADGVSVVDLHLDGAGSDVNTVREGPVINRVGRVSDQGREGGSKRMD